MFRLVADVLDPAALKALLLDPRAGACVTFEGWVRNHNAGRPVQALDYEAHSHLAETEGGRIVEEARQQYGLPAAYCLHRVGELQVGELAVWVGVCAPHRGPAFEACRYIIDQVKVRVPIWKKEHYADGESGWINAGG